MPTKISPLLTTKAIVTGGGGFLGFKIVKMLIKKGYEVSSFSRHNYTKLNKIGIKHIIGDISNYQQVNEACQNQDIVFHTAAIAGVDGAYKKFFKINYLGTENIIKACLENKVKKLIYTSSPSVAYNLEDIKGKGEEIGYPSSYLSHYSSTKAQAEKLILTQNQQKLLTCAIRPHLIWGEYDNHLIPTLIQAARQKSIAQIGDGTNIVDITYVDNAAYAHILAEENLIDHQSLVAGQAYFIGDKYPVNLWEWINNLLMELEEPAINTKIPFLLAYNLGFILEILQKLTAFPKKLKLNRFIAFQLAKSHYFSHKKAQEHLNYYPIIDSKLAMQKTKIWWLDAKNK